MLTTAFRRYNSFSFSHLSPVLKSERYLSRTLSSGVFDKMGVIGVGTMAEAMIAPVIGSGLQPVEDIYLYDVSSAALEGFKKKYPGIKTAQSMQEVVEKSDLVVCAVKPQNLSTEFFTQIDPSPDTILLSVVAGSPVSTFIKGGFSKVARSMPNTPAQIGKGMTVWCATDNFSSEEKENVKKLLSSFGKQVYVEDEDFIDMSTSISGSGPAYIFMLMEAMIDAGVHMGFSRPIATTLVHQTILGSTLYAMETKEHPVVLRNSVTSPAGTTASAIYELENGKFRTVIKDAIWACYRRSLEMGQKDSNVGPGRMGKSFVIVPKGELKEEDMEN
mmetsp:Transcript_14703/g.21688  ORF Transcript_14703/g.21688 Transcript_14703/m.21688 type:complete len:331 (-) Transcript_14703:719-1711(-)